MIYLLGLIVGIVFLIAGGTILVKGASQVASDFGISPLVIGLTIVGFGTSAPELIVSVMAGLRGSSGLAFGNVIGSNISNIALILGAAAIVMPMTIQGQLVRREIPLLILATTIISVMALDGRLGGGNPIISMSDGIILLLIFCVFVYMIVMDIVREQLPDPIVGEIELSKLVNNHPEVKYPWIQVLAGMLLLFVGGETTIRNGTAFAEFLGIAGVIVGLFFVAVGTSMPELVTSIIAAKRNEPDLALGNIVGSNMFNSLIVLPVGATINPTSIPTGGVFDLSVSWFLTFLLIPIFIFGEAKLTRKTGVLLLFIYIVYAGLRIFYFS